MAPPRLAAGAGAIVSLKLGSSLSRDLGVFSTVELRVEPLLDPETEEDDDVGAAAAGMSDGGGSTIEGTVRTEPRQTILPW